jgi:hypothetical protein
MYRNKMHKYFQTHSKQEETGDSTDTDDAMIQSPADIYSHFYKTSGPKSILKDSVGERKNKKDVTVNYRNEQKTTSTEPVKEVPKPVVSETSDYYHII